MLRRAVKHVLARALIAFALLTVALCAPSAALALCTSPAGVEGDMVYNSTWHVLQFCDNASTWRPMGAVPGTETDPQVGTLTNPDLCTTNGTTIDCTTAAVDLGTQVTGNLPRRQSQQPAPAHPAAPSGAATQHGPASPSPKPIHRSARWPPCAYCRANTGGTAIDCISEPPSSLPDGAFTLVAWWKFDDGSGTTRRGFKRPR